MSATLTDTAQRLKIGVIVYSCRPGMGSEPGVGWNTIKYLSQHHDVWAITRGDNRPFIEAELAQEPMNNVTWEFIEIPVIGKPWTTIDVARRIHYYLWQWFTYLHVRRLLRDVQLDLLHHITYVTYWTPSFVAYLPVPFIWGPVGGGERTPPAYYDALSSKGVRKERLRDAVRLISRIDPFLRSTARRAERALSTTEQTADVLRRLGSPAVSVQSQLIVSDETIAQFSALPQYDGQPFRFISIGRLLEWKGFQFGLQAFAKLADAVPDSEYWIVGDGPYRSALEALVADHNLGQRVRFLGHVDHEDVPQRLAECNVLVHPSLHDSGGNVILEAQLARRPVICLDWGGPGVLVTAETGIKFQPQTPAQDVQHLAEAMRQLVQDPDLCRQMGQRGQQHVIDEFHWERRITGFNQLYQELLAVPQK